GFGFVVGAPPRREPRTRRAQICVTGRPPFAPGAGAPTGSGGHVLVFCCRSTASVRTANEAGTDWRLGQVPIRTRGGCSYGFAGGFGFCCMTIHFRRVSYMWRVLAEHANNIKDTHLAQFFADDSQRFGRLHSECGPLLFDYSKQRLTAETLERLFDLARQQQLPEWIDRLFCGEPVNSTEGR